ncbi:MAG: GspE/PulE family protein [Desulfovibrionaceae bacterium]|nr:GspE/PulE family protein [Desulfovibrionaceae bacterium]
MAHIRMRIGELLVKDGLLTEAQLQHALEQKRPEGMKLGELLIRQGIVDEESVARVICAQAGIERYSAERFPFNREVAAKVPATVAQRNKAVPLMMHGSVLCVAMVDPLDIDALDRLEKVADCEVDAVMCLLQEFTQLFGLIYGNYTGIDGVIQTLGADNDDQPDKALEIIQTRDDEVGDAGAPDEAPVVRLVNAILAQGVREGASDIHISPEKESLEVRFRIDGRLRKVPSVPHRVASSVISRIKILGNMDISVNRIPQDGRFTILVDSREINVRVSSLPTIYGENVVMRLLDMSAKRLYTLPQLGMNPADCEKIEKYARKPYGMILSTGPTGSGKSTSLYSILQMVNRADLNTITLEDPVEYRVHGIRQVQLNARAGMTFASGLRSILRQDPDILMVGEIRDGETAQIAVQAALTGHLVFSTLHTNDATGAVSRLIDMGVEPYLVASVLLCSFAQRLVRVVCPHCKEVYQPSPVLLESFGLPAEGTYYHGKGCFRCGNTGYLGRMGLFEVMTMPLSLQEAVAGRVTTQTLRQMALAEGMRTLAADAAEKINAGQTTVEEAARVAMV